MDKALQVTMLGSFTITGNGKAVDDSSNRMRKVWLLLAYLIWSRNSPVTQDSYLSLLQGSGTSESEDPASRMKALFYRARAMLNDLWPNAGHELILHRNRTYSWNTQIPLTLDVEEFDRLCAAAADHVSQIVSAHGLYHGVTVHTGRKPGTNRNDRRGIGYIRTKVSFRQNGIHQRIRA